jgi:hypothetical protein
VFPKLKRQGALCEARIVAGNATPLIEEEDVFEGLRVFRFL